VRLMFNSLVAQSKFLIVPAALVVCGGVAYGSLFAANKIAIESGFPFVAYTFWQAMIAGLVLLAFAVARGDVPKVSIIHLRQYGLMSLLGVVVPVLVLTFIADKLPAGVVTLIIGLTPSLTYLFAFILGRERFRWLAVGGVLFGFASILLIVLPEQSLAVSGSAVWLVVALLVPLSVAINLLVISYLRPPETTTVSLVCGLLLSAALITFVCMLVSGEAYVFWNASGPGIWAMVWASAGQLVAFIAGLEVARMAGPVYVSQMNYVIVGSGFVWALVLFDESLSIWVWTAFVLIFLGLTLTNLSALRAAKR